MALLQQPIQRKLSALIGAEVTFDKFSISLLKGVIEAAGVTVAGEDAATPLLTIARVRAEIAVKRALKGEIIVRSLTVERPVVRIVRRSDGTTNLPRPIRDDAAEKTDEQQAPTPGPAPGPAPAPAEQDDKTSWKFDAEKVLVVDGDLDARFGDHHVTAKQLLAELKRAGDGYSMTLLIDSLKLSEDAAAPALAVRASGTIDRAADLAALPRSPARLNVEIGDLARVTLTTPSLSSRDDLHISFDGAFALGRLLALLPRR